MSVVDLELDPWRGGFEIREGGQVVALVAGQSRGGPKLAERHQLVEGEHPFDPSGTRCGTVDLTYDPRTQLLTIDVDELRVRVRLEQAPTLLRVAFADFK